MSLPTLMKNYCTIQSVSKDGGGPVQTDDGALDRSGSWVNQFENIKCHIQEKSRHTVSERYAKLEEEHNDLIYHQNLSVYNFTPATDTRILVYKDDPTKQITDYENEETFVIYQFKGRIEQVKGQRRRWKFYIIRCERNERWKS